MIRLFALTIALLAAPAAQAQIVPNLELDNPRLQTVQWEDGLEILLTVMPSTGLTIMLESGEQIERVTMSDPIDFDVRVSPEGNSLLVLPNGNELAGRMVVDTDRRSYPFSLRTGEGLTAAYLVRFTYGNSPAADLAPQAALATPDTSGARWTYRLRGDSEVRPQSIRDDGTRTYITYHADQALPAVFAIGQTGDEEMVNGHMRGDIFVIDRVYSELVFRLDDERARARRNAQPGEAG